MRARSAVGSLPQLVRSGCGPRPLPPCHYPVPLPLKVPRTTTPLAGHFGPPPPRGLLVCGIWETVRRQCVCVTRKKNCVHNKAAKLLLLGTSEVSDVRMEGAVNSPVNCPLWARGGGVPGLGAGAGEWDGDWYGVWVRGLVRGVGDFGCLAGMVQGDSGNAWAGRVGRSRGCLVRAGRCGESGCEGLSAPLRRTVRLPQCNITFSK